MENSRGTLVSSIAASTVLRKSFSEIALLAARLAVRVHDHAQVLGDGHARDRDGVLEGHEQAGAGALVRIGLRDVLAVEQDLALGDLEVRVAHDRVGERRLAGAVRAHQRVELAGADVQVHALEDLLVPGGDVQVLDLEVSHESPVVCRCGWADGRELDELGERGALQRA